ncbi:hypothetical protein ADL28_04240 [Streptomyces violaceusniger]|uniref:Uncharacterized protein n=1 Tax=Streptomyces violaceusniger TaxID=68280 RepID=A0A0X3XBJ6_STRVO|nr:hypothetical protein ADL28_04240 [Streptomyces violaceusniger]
MMPYGSAASLVVGGVPVAQRAQTAGQVGELEGPAELGTHGMLCLLRAVTLGWGDGSSGR